MVQTVTAMASDMNRPVQFSMLLVSPEARGMESGRTEVFIRVQDLQSENEFLWVKDKFLNRYGYMQEMYHDFETNGVVPDVPKEKDPFWEPADLEVVVGVASLPLAFLAHMIRFDDEPLNILDYVANHCGYLKIELVPCNQKGAESDKLSVNDPMDLVGKPISFKIKIRSATNLPERFAKTWCRFRFYENADWTVTDVKDGQNPRYNFEDLIQYKSADYKLIDYLKDKSMAVEIIGQQRASSSNKNRQNRTGMLEELQNKVRTLEEKLEQVQKIINTLPEKDATRAKIQKVISR
jgi:kinesin family protein 1